MMLFVLCVALWLFAAGLLHVFFFCPFCDLIVVICGSCLAL